MSGHIPGRSVSLAHNRLDSPNYLFDSTKLSCQAVNIITSFLLSVKSEYWPQSTMKKPPFLDCIHVVFWQF